MQVIDLSNPLFCMRMTAEDYIKTRQEDDPSAKANAGERPAGRKTMFSLRKARNFSAPHAIYLEAATGYFGHQYQPFRRLSNQPGASIVVKRTANTFCPTAIQ
jgi:hypothetical protein